MSRRGARAVKTALAALLGAALFMLPSLAAACSVCMSNDQEDTRLAFILTTAFMTFLPLTVLFFTIRWFVRRARIHDEAQDQVRVARAASAPLEPTPTRP